MNSRHTNNYPVSTLFSGIRYFTPDEFDHPAKVDRDALSLLDAMRHTEGKLRTRPIVIVVHADYASSGHSPKSRHAFGDAFDISFLDRETRKPLGVVDQFLTAIRYTWTGIGFYPYWNNPGVHVDRRPITVKGRRSLWWRDSGGNYRAVSDFFSKEEVFK